MKRLLHRMLLVFGVLVFAVPAWSLTIDSGGTNVGSVDTLLNSADLPNSGYATELAWVQTYVPGATLTVYDAVNFTWILTDGQTDIYAAELQGTPDYYFLKTGAGPGEDDHFLFTNLAALNYAVLDFGDLNFTNIGVISHVGETGGTSVTEPGTLMLLGSGLLGFAVMDRRRRRMED